MTPALLNSTLPDRLLIAISRAHHAGDPPPDWQECAAAASVSARQTTISHALVQLANEGLIEGVMAPDGWLALRPTPRGLARAGRDAHLDLGDSGPGPAGASAPRIYRSGSERVSVTVEEVCSEFRLLSQYAGVAWRRARETATPRLIAVRATMANTWHMFTSFP